MLSTLLEKTDPARRRIGTAIVVGIIGGFLSAIVKFGWEVPFPPRTPERNATNPPQRLLEQLGMSPEQSHTGVTFNGNEGLPIILLHHPLQLRDRPGRLFFIYNILSS